MANPYESNGVDPFKEPSPTAERHPSPYDEAVSPITLTYTIPTNPPSSTLGNTAADTTTHMPLKTISKGYETAYGVPLAGSVPPVSSVPGSMGTNTTDSASAPAGGASVFSIGYYQSFFDVTTRQVLNRITNAMVPICPPDYLYGRNWHFTTTGPSDSESNATENDLVVAGVKLSRNPDLYGPFWICTTLWITMGVIGNVMSRIAYARQHGGEHTDRWIFDFTLVPVACATIYLYCFVFGSIVWGVMKWKYLPVTLIDMVCLYGYSMFVFLLVALLCVVPSTGFQWVVVLLGGVWSSSYLVANLWHMLKRNLSPQWFIGIVGGVALGQLLLTLSFKLYFFHYSI